MHPVTVMESECKTEIGIEKHGLSASRETIVLIITVVMSQWAWTLQNLRLRGTD